jgi:hypothetical protein
VAIRELAPFYLNPGSGTDSRKVLSASGFRNARRDDERARTGNFGRFGLSRRGSGGITPAQGWPECLVFPWRLVSADRWDQEGDVLFGHAGACRSCQLNWQIALAAIPHWDASVGCFLKNTASSPPVAHPLLGWLPLPERVLPTIAAKSSRGLGRYINFLLRSNS